MPLLFRSSKNRISGNTDEVVPIKKQHGINIMLNSDARHANSVFSLPGNGILHRFLNGWISQGNSQNGATV